MSDKKTVTTHPVPDQELTNWERIDRLEAELERKKPKKTA